MALDASSKSTPAGWRAGDSNYPLKRFLELLEVWKHLTDLEAEKVAIAVASRLVGRVQTLALSLTITKQDQSVLRGCAALAFQGEPVHRSTSTTSHA